MRVGRFIDFSWTDRLRLKLMRFLQSVSFSASLTLAWSLLPIFFFLRFEFSQGFFLTSCVVKQRLPHAISLDYLLVKVKFRHMHLLFCRRRHWNLVVVKFAHCCVELFRGRVVLKSLWGGVVDFEWACLLVPYNETIRESCTWALIRKRFVTESLLHQFRFL